MPTQLRILHIVESAGAGVGRHVADLVGGLVDRGDVVDLVYGASRVDGEFRRRLPSLGVRHAVEMPMTRRPGFGDVRAHIRLRRLIRAFGPYDVIHGHASKGGFHSRLLSRKVTRVYTPNALVTQSPQLGRAERLVYATVERRLARRTDGLVMVSAEEAEHAASLGLRPRHQTVIPNGIDPVELPDRDAARAALGLEHEDVVVGFVGRLTTQKGVERLIDAAALMPRQVPVTWAIVGDGELSEALRTRSERVGVAAAVRWLGARPGQASMRAFDLLVMPSLYEGFPYVALEALQAGIPVIASASSSVAALLSDGRAGRIVNGNPESIAGAVADAVQDSDRRRAWADAAPLVAAQHTAQGMVDATRSFYLEVLPRRSLR